ncbi:arylsulfatase H [Pteronotus mesoamericanus]|uniref:arylsulfatase H n=1 Tax=Pteronotus mesoamericanus TaxID=1884717 RepID=UPI0023ECDCAE|nr:arylsulfatase H [Pteronotus parnellii mesoamericanus]
MGKAPLSRNSRPNIVLLMADDLGAGDLGSYGYNTLSTPNLDRLAAEGVRLAQPLAAASVGTASRAAFLTGRYPVRWGMASAFNRIRGLTWLGGSGGLPATETTFTELLQRRGYRTGLIGKWHQGLSCATWNDHCCHPLNHGFDSFCGLPFGLLSDCRASETPELHRGLRTTLAISTAVVGLAPLLLLIPKCTRWWAVPWKVTVPMELLALLFFVSWYSSYGFVRRWNCILMRNHEIIRQPMQEDRATSLPLKEAVSFIDRHREEPFLLFYSFLHVHTPLPTTEQFLGTSKHGLYGDNVQEMDFFVGRLLAAIDELGLRNHTLVYFTSDHGGHLEARLGQIQLGGWNGIYRGGQAMAGWEGGIRVPGLVRWPGKLQAGKIIDEPTSLMDIFPTIAAWTGATVPQDRPIDGRNLMPLLLGDVERSEHEFLFHYCDAYLHAARWHPRDSEAVWKVHYVTPVFLPPGAQACYEIKLCKCTGEYVSSHDPPLLFDLSRDPSESTPLTRDTEPLYDLVITKVSEAVRQHKKTIIPVELQLEKERNHDHIWLRPCCGVFPFCICDKEGAHHPEKLQWTEHRQ